MLILVLYPNLLNVSYNERLMRKVRSDNSRFGIPQGPAYARVVAELFLNRILEQLPEKKIQIKNNMNYFVMWMILLFFIKIV